MWWAALHCLLLAASVGLGVPLPIKFALAVLLGVHAWRRRPHSAVQPVIQHADGCWGLPEQDLAGLTLARGTSYTLLWARLVLTGGGETIDILLLKDQLDEIAWRGLQVRLRCAVLE